jgi:hypothetical protein
VWTVRASRHHPATHSLKISVGCQGQRGAATKAAAHSGWSHGATVLRIKHIPRPAHRGRAIPPTSGAAERFARPETLTGRPKLPVLPHHHSNGHACRWAKLLPNCPYSKEVSGSAFETGL